MFKGRKCKKCKDAYPVLWQKFKEGRARGHCVHFHRLLSKGRVIYCKSREDESAKLGYHVITRSLQELSREKRNNPKLQWLNRLRCSMELLENNVYAH